MERVGKKDMDMNVIEEQLTDIEENENQGVRRVEKAKKKQFAATMQHKKHRKVHKLRKNLLSESKDAQTAFLKPNLITNAYLNRVLSNVNNHTKEKGNLKREKM